ncbi:MAG: glycosyltransferase family 9 protein [Limisphaerales bacterium]
MATRENILLIRLKSIGDIVLTLPAVHAVRENFPDAKLHFLVSKEHAQLLRGFSEMDEIIPVDRAIYRSGNLKTIGAATVKLLRELRARNFSLAIDFQGYGETEWLSWWSGAPERWGNVYQARRGWTYTRGVRHNNKIQIADWNLSLLQQCGLEISEIRNEYVLPAEALAEARQFFTANNLDAAKPTLFIQPFTSSRHKNWPLENYLALTRHFHSRGAQIIFGGGPSERNALDPVRAAGFPISAGAPLLVGAGLMQLSTLVVGGITGLLHLAVAMQKRVVMLVGYPTRELGFPYQHREWAVTSAAGGNVSEIKTGAVIEACENALADKRALEDCS